MAKVQILIVLKQDTQHYYIKASLSYEGLSLKKSSESQSIADLKRKYAG